MNLIEDPENTVNLDLAGFPKISEQGIAGKQDAPVIDFCQSKRKSVMNRPIAAERG
jgi:hypothetical protein